MRNPFPIFVLATVVIALGVVSCIKPPVKPMPQPTPPVVVPEPIGEPAPVEEPVSQPLDPVPTAEVCTPKSDVTFCDNAGPPQKRAVATGHYEYQRSGLFGRRSVRVWVQDSGAYYQSSCSSCGQR